MANKGNEIKALFEPAQHSNTRSQATFNKYFGRDRKNVCVFAFEGNWQFEQELLTLQETYRKQGFRIKTFTSRSGLIDFGSFIGSAIVGRVLPEQPRDKSHSPAVVIKSAVAYDQGLWARTISSGYFCDIDAILVETSLNWLENAIKFLSESEKGQCTVDYINN